MLIKIIIRSLLIVLTAVYSFLFAVYLAYGYVGSIWDWIYGDDGILVIMILFSLIFLFILLFISITGSILKKYNLDKNNWASIVLVTILGGLLIPVVKDSPTVKNDYSLSDLKVPPEKAEESFDTLNKMFTDMKKGIEVKLPDAIDKKKYSNVISYKKEILEAWNKVYPWRKYIEQLNSYSTIADLTEPYLGDFYYFSKFRQLTHIYSAYAVLQVKEGNVKEGIKALTEIQSVVTRSLPCSRFLIHNLLWTAIAEMNLRSAYIIASDPQCSDSDLLQLKKHFPPLLDYEKPFSNMFISEYIFAQRSAEEGSGDTGIIEAMFPGKTDERNAESFLRKSFFTVLSLLTYKENRTLSDLKKYHDLFINSSQSYQDLSSSQEYMSNYTSKPSLINSSGWMIITIACPDFRSYVERMTDMAVKSDLLVLYIDSRLGNDTELIDRFTGEKYHKGKEPYLYLSAGIDGLPGTEDDISLK